MMTLSQHQRLQDLTVKPWRGLLNYFRSMKADWDALEALGYVTPSMVSDANGVEVWEYAITEAGRAALEAAKNSPHE